MKLRLLSAGQEKRLVKELMSMWFGERTLSRAREMVLSVIPRRAGELDQTLAGFDRFRLKSRDLSGFLREQPWKAVKFIGASQRAASAQSPAHRI